MPNDSPIPMYPSSVGIHSLTLVEMLHVTSC